MGRSGAGAALGMAGHKEESQAGAGDKVGRATGKRPVEDGRCAHWTTLVPRDWTATSRRFLLTGPFEGVPPVTAVFK